MIDYAAPPARRCLVLAQHDQRRADLAQIAAADGAKIIDGNYLFAAAPVDEWPSVDYVLAELLSDLEQAGAYLSELAGYLADDRCQLLLWTDLELLEEAYAVLPADQCHFMVDASDIDAMPILAWMDRHMSLDQFHDPSRDGEYRALHKISDELADFARTLARIAEQEETPPSAVRDKPLSYRAAPADVFKQLISDMGEDDEAAKVRHIIKLRRLRERHFDSSLFADPAWDILLDLYAAKLENKQVSVSSLCIAAAVPPTTALRWITSMTEHGALVREQDPNDARRVFIRLSDDSERRLKAYFVDVADRRSFPI